MKPVTQLVRVAHGSHLYGTSTPTSDQDFKGVHLPSGEAIVLQRAEDVLERGVKSKIAGTDKNAADAVDDQSYSLQKFFGMLAKGDTVATEILFAPYPVEADPAWADVQIVGRRLLNRQCKGFVGYCVRQHKDWLLDHSLTPHAERHDIAPQIQIDVGNQRRLVGGALGINDGPGWRGLRIIEPYPEFQRVGQSGLIAAALFLQQRQPFVSHRLRVVHVIELRFYGRVSDCLARKVAVGRLDRGIDGRQRETVRLGDEADPLGGCGHGSTGRRCSVQRR